MSRPVGCTLRSMLGLGRRCAPCVAAPWGTNNCFAGVALLLHPEEGKKKTTLVAFFLSHWCAPCWLHPAETVPFLHHCDSRGGLHQPVCACLLHPNFLWSVPFGHLGCIIVFGLRFWGFPFGAELVCHSLRNYPDFCQECAVLRDRPFGKAQSLYA